MKKVLTLALAATLLLSINACGGSTVTAGTPGAKGPEWVMKGSGAFGGEKKAFYGVGTSTGIANVSLARKTADDRAHSELGAVFNKYTADLTKAYMASTTAGDMSASSEEQHVENAMKSFTQSNLSGVEIVDRWFDEGTNTWYSLARLDMDKMINALEGHKELSAKVRDYVRQNAERAFAGLEAEEAKHAN